MYFNPLIMEGHTEILSGFQWKRYICHYKYTIKVKKMEKIVIIGGVAAGATAAAKVRRISATAQITMIEAGPDISFANCGLPYYIGGDIKNRSALILQSPESFKAQYGVDVYTHTLVSSIDRNAHKVKTVDTRNGEKKVFEYTRLILAQGGRPVIPEITGAKNRHVFTLWTLEDMDKIARHLDEERPENAVVVGGGFIGLEMAEAMVKRGLKVHIVELLPHVMSTMEAETAGFIENELLSYGVGIHTNAVVSEITQDTVKLDDGSVLDAGIVLLSIGVRPTLQLAKETGLELGEAGGLRVNRYLQTSDPDIYAAGDMIEVEHRINGKKVRIPLAGPANRQGRIAAENAMGGKHPYRGALGTSIVRVFDMLAGMTGLSLKQARAAGIDADSVVVHKEHHTSYYPDAEMVSVMLVYDRKTAVILGGQTAGYQGADKRLDAIAVAAASKLTIHELADVDLAYSPPVGTANDALNMAAYAAENKISGFSSSVMVSELDAFVEGKDPLFLDVRDFFSFRKSHISGAVHLPLELISKQTAAIPPNKMIILYDETGKKGHQALRILKGAGYNKVTHISGGYISLQRQAQTTGFKYIKVEPVPVKLKNVIIEDLDESGAAHAKESSQNTPVVVDVRTSEEFNSGAYPGAINIPLDELTRRYHELGNNITRDIIVYCASGARSAYAENMLSQLGYSNVKNGGGLSSMMARQTAKAETSVSNEPLVIDVRTKQEFMGGAYPGAVNIPVDELPAQIDQLGSRMREITVYCASGARSSYAQQILKQSGFTNVRNGGGIMQMMMRR
jgi:NADPH-dependent 2,4-dienoyl-CoA reductase/sulfur reductase-like enzyme/rhodanese-related sulfurtransferase